MSMQFCDGCLHSHALYSGELLCTYNLYCCKLLASCFLRKAYRLGDNWSYFTQFSTLSTLAWKNFLASSPAQTFTIERSPDCSNDLPLCAPSCLKIGRALRIQQSAMFLSSSHTLFTHPEKRSMLGSRLRPIPSRSRMLSTTFMKSPSILT